MISMPRREFLRLVRQAYRELPRPIQRSLKNVDISVEDWPDAKALGLPDGEAMLFGLYTGVPLPERQGGEPELPDRIVIYRRPILRNCKTRAEATKEIRVTLLHEVGHYLGMDEEGLQRLGYG